MRFERTLSRGIESGRLWRKGGRIFRSFLLKSKIIFRNGNEFETIKPKSIENGQCEEGKKKKKKRKREKEKEKNLYLIIKVYLNNPY